MLTQITDVSDLFWNWLADACEEIKNGRDPDYNYFPDEYLWPIVYAAVMVAVISGGLDPEVAKTVTLSYQNEVGKNRHYPYEGLLSVYFSDISGKCKENNQACYPENINAIIRYIRRSLNSKLTVEDLAAKAGMNPRRFSSYFHKTVGITPKEFILREKIYRAKIYLEYSDMDIRMISDLLGFSSPSHLTNTFEEITGICPSDYRYYSGYDF